MNRFAACLLLAVYCPAQAFAGKYDDGIRLLEAKSYVKAASAFEAAAKEGDSGAERQLGFMYYRGLGFKQDNAKAVAEFERAGTHGDLESQVNFALGRSAIWAPGFRVTRRKRRSGGPWLCGRTMTPRDRCARCSSR